MSAYTKDIATVPDEAQPISDDMFHANIVANKNTLVPGGPFDTTLNKLGVTGLRYPGGTVTEQHLDPMSPLWRAVFGPSDTQYVKMSNGEYFIGPEPVIDYVAANNLDFTLVLPTSTLVTTNSRGQEVIDGKALDRVLEMVEDMIEGKYGSVSIDRIEIGNEYQAYPDMSAATYGMVANKLTLGLVDIFEAHDASAASPPGWKPPEIGLQMGPAWRKGDAETITAALEPAAAAGVTGDIIVHYYPENLDGVNDRTALFENHNIWDKAHGHHHGFAISEWNIASGANSDAGLAHASSLISAFDQMAREGVDEAEIWGVQFRFSRNALSTISEHDHPDANQADIVTRLTAAGEIFASLGESVLGLRPFDPTLSILMDNNGATESIGPVNDQADIIVNAFGNTDRATMYFSSRSDTPVNISLNLQAYFGSYSHIWGEVLTTVDNPATPGVDEDNPLAVNGIPEYEIYNAADFANGEVITLQPYEILRVNVQLDGGGVTMRGHDGKATDPIDMDDTLIGSAGADSIHGFGGEDKLVGGSKGDVLHGGDAEDRLEGGGDNDTLRGGLHDDVLYGGTGGDVLSGGKGADSLLGGSENDVLVGGGGNDKMYGHEGRDILHADSGTDTVFGGTGGDYFVIGETSQVVIGDWNPADGDRITFLGQFSSFEDLQARTTTTAGTATDPGDLVITGPEGSRTVITDGAGKMGWLKGDIVDFTPEGEAALDLAQKLDSRDADGAKQYVKAMDQGAFEREVLDADPVMLFASLDADSAASLLGGINEDQTEDLLQGEGGSALSMRFEGLQDKGLAVFVNTLSVSGLESVVDELGFDSVTARAEDVSSRVADNLDRKMQHTSYKDEEIRSSDHGDPDDPRPEEEPEEEPEVASSGCFVATAVYGDPYHPDVCLLRRYRETVLRKSAPGRAFIAFYARFGPYAARMVRGRPWLHAIAYSVIARIVEHVAGRHNFPR